MQCNHNVKPTISSNKTGWIFQCVQRTATCQKTCLLCFFKPEFLFGPHLIALALIGGSLRGVQFGLEDDHLFLQGLLLTLDLLHHVLLLRPLVLVVHQHVVGHLQLDVLKPNTLVVLLVVLPPHSHHSHQSKRHQQGHGDHKLHLHGVQDEGSETVLGAGVFLLGAEGLPAAAEGSYSSMKV